MNIGYYRDTGSILFEYYAEEVIQISKLLKDVLLENGMEICEDILYMHDGFCHRLLFPVEQKKIAVGILSGLKSIHDDANNVAEAQKILNVILKIDSNFCLHLN